MSDEKSEVVGEWKERVWIVRAQDGRKSAEPASLSKLRRGLELGKLTEDMDISRDDLAWENIRAVIDRVSKRVARPAPSPNESMEIPALTVAKLAELSEPIPVLQTQPRAMPSAQQALAAQPVQRFAPGPVAARSFGGGLFDVNFNTFVTTNVVRVLYILHILFVSFWLVGWIVVGVGAIGAGATGGTDSFLTGSLGGVMSIVIGIVSSILLLLFGRIFLECIVVAFRIAETLGEINAKTR